MTEREKAEVDKIKAETKQILNNIRLKWYAAITVTLLGGTPFFNIIKDFFK
jgi:hypothetical protein